MIVKCIVCGKDAEQKSAKGRLYCSDDCFRVQKARHVRTEEWCKEELARRQQAYIAYMTEDEQERLNKKRAADMKQYYMRKPGLQKVRFCHDCHKPCNDYRCADCWSKLRGTASFLKPCDRPSETEWDYF